MEFKQLEAYVHVYEQQSFSKAAQLLYVSQPSVSSYIHALEKELQTQLIHRSTKEFVPTKTGVLFYEYAKELLALRDTSVSSLRDHFDCSRGSIDILASSVPAQYLLPQVLGQFHAQYQGVTFNVRQADTAAAIQGIAGNQSEIGFVGSKVENHRCLFEKFLSESMLLIAPPCYGSAGTTQEAVIELLKSEHFVSREDGSGTRREYEEYLRSQGVDPSALKISASFDNTQAVMHAVMHGLGLAIVSELAAQHYLEQKLVVSLPLAAPPTRDFYLVLRKNKPISAPVEKLIELVHSLG